TDFVYGSSMAYGSNSYFTNARRAFVNGDIKETIEQLERSLKTNLSSRDKEEALKLLGICNYIVGKKSHAKNNFAQALAINKNAVLNKKDVLDPDINTLFASVKSQNNAKQKPT